MRPIVSAVVSCLCWVACGAAGAQIAAAKIESVSGDRQIVVAPLGTVPRPTVAFEVRVLDAAGQPVPGINVLIEESGGPDQPALFTRDEFGFRGFNAGDSKLPGGGPRDHLAVTDALGKASAAGQFFTYAPASLLIMGTVYLQPIEPALFTTVLVRAAPPGNPKVIVEYFHASTGHYFDTLFEADIVALDKGTIPGWRRSIGAFLAYESAADAPSGAVPVCRFFGPSFTSHFYSASAAECDAVSMRWPDLWVLETREAFYINVPDAQSGKCPAGTGPVYRLFNNQPQPNHRYVTDRALRDAMVRSGWVAEGFGPEYVVFCTPT